MLIFNWIKKKKELVKQKKEESTSTIFDFKTSKNTDDNAELKKSQYESQREYNSSVFEKFYADLRNHNLPDIPDPTVEEIMECQRERQEGLNKNISSTMNVEKLRNNMETIPVEVQIWVDKVYEYYFDDLIPMLGLVHSCESAKKALYQYKGYTWFKVSEINPDLLYD